MGVRGEQAGRLTLWNRFRRVFHFGQNTFEQLSG